MKKLVKIGVITGLTVLTIAMVSLDLWYLQ